MAQKVGTIYAEIDLDASRYLSGQQTLLKSATSTSLSIEQNFKNLGVKSDAVYDLMRQKAINSFEMISNSAKATANDIIRAEQAKNETLKKLYEDQYKSVDKLNAKMGDLTGGISSVAKAAVSMAAAFATYQVANYIKDTALLAARYETLGIVMKVVGQNTGYSQSTMEEYSKALQKTGISMNESRQSLTRMAQANLDLTQSTKLARIAQDAAVIGNMNSSESFQTLIHGIQSAQVEVLRTVGINVSFENSYKKVADELGRTVDSFSESEKATIRMNAVLDSGKNISGAYEAAMNTAGKQLTSFSRYVEDFGVKMGEAFGPATKILVEAATKAMKEMQDEISKPDAQEALKNLSMALAETIVHAGKDLPEAIGKLKSSVQSITDIYNSLPDDVIGAAGYGIVGKMLFGRGGGALVALIAYHHAKIEEFKKQHPEIFLQAEGEKRFKIPFDPGPVDSWISKINEGAAATSRFAKESQILADQQKAAAAASEKAATESEKAAAKLEAQQKREESAALKYAEVMDTIHGKMSDFDGDSYAAQIAKIDKEFVQMGKTVGQNNAELLKWKEQATEAAGLQSVLDVFPTGKMSTYPRDMAKVEEDAAKERLTIERQMYKDMSKDGSDSLAEQIRLIDDRKAAYLKAGGDMNIADKWYAGQYDKIQDKNTLAFGSFTDGVALGYKDMKKDAESWASEGKKAFDRFQKAGTSAISDGLFHTIKGDMTDFGAAWESFTDSLLQTFTDMIAKMVVQETTSLIFGSSSGSGSSGSGISLGNIIGGVSTAVSAASEFGGSAVTAVADAGSSAIDWIGSFFASGGQYSSNEPFIAGEQGWEIVDPRSNTVYNHRDSMAIAGAIGAQIPEYAEGTGYARDSLDGFLLNPSDFADSLGPLIVAANPDVFGGNGAVGGSLATGTANSSIVGGNLGQTAKAMSSAFGLMSSLATANVIGAIISGYGLSQAIMGMISSDPSSTPTISQSTMDNAASMLGYSGFDGDSFGFGDSGNSGDSGDSGQGDSNGGTGPGGAGMGASGAGAWATGGQYDPNRMFWAGEEGAELIDPRTRTVLSHSDSMDYAARNSLHVPGYASGTSTADTYVDKFYSDSEKLSYALDKLLTALTDQGYLGMDDAKNMTQSRAAYANYHDFFVQNFSDTDWGKMIVDYMNSLSGVADEYFTAIENQAADAAQAAADAEDAATQAAQDTADRIKAIQATDDAASEYYLDILGYSTNLGDSIDNVKAKFKEYYEASDLAGKSADYLNNILIAQGIALKKVADDWAKALVQPIMDLASSMLEWAYQINGVSTDIAALNSLMVYRKLKGFSATGTADVLNFSGMNTNQVEAYVTELAKYATTVANALETVYNSFQTVKDSIANDIESISMDGKTTEEQAQYYLDQVGATWSSLSTMSYEDVPAAMDEMRSQLMSYYDLEKQIIADKYQASEDLFAAEIENIEAVRDKLTTLTYSGYNLALPTVKMDSAQQDYDSLLAAAKTGDSDSISNFLSFTDTFLKSSQDANKSSQRYLDDYAKVMADISGLDTQKGTSIQDLTSRQNQLIEDNTKAMESELADLRDAMTNALTAGVNSINTSMTDVMTKLIAEYDILVDLTARGYGKGYADGGISSGPTTGYLTKMHGTEAHIPLKNGSIPVSISRGGDGGYSDPEVKNLLRVIVAQGDKKQNVTLVLDNGRSFTGYVQSVADELDQNRYDKKIGHRNYR